MARLGPFLVPQFIDVETKIIGPITTRQFVIMLIAGMVDFILYKLLYFNTFIVLGLLVFGAFGIVAFFRINGMPFHYFFLNLVQTLKRPRLRIWSKALLKEKPAEEKIEIQKEFIPKPPLPESKLSKLSLVVNTGGAYRQE